MKAVLFTLTLALTLWEGHGIVRDYCYPKGKGELVIKCPRANDVILIASIKSQKVADNFDCNKMSGVDQTKWMRADPSYIWIYCNLNIVQCKRKLKDGFITRLDYDCVTLGSITSRSMNLCANVKKFLDTPVYFHSPGYHPTRRGLFYFDWTTKCVCRISARHTNTVYNFTLSIHDSIAATSDGPSVRWGYSRENVFEDMGKHSMVSLKRIASDVFVYFIPESPRQLGWFWMKLESQPKMTLGITCNGAGTLEPAPTVTAAAITTTTRVPTTTTSPTTTTILPTTTAKKTTSPPTTAKTATSPPTSSSGSTSVWNPPVIGGKDGQKKPGGSGTDDQLKKILIPTAIVPWIIILIIAVIGIVIYIRRARAKKARDNRHDRPFELPTPMNTYPPSSVTDGGATGMRQAENPAFMCHLGKEEPIYSHATSTPTLGATSRETRARQLQQGNRDSDYMTPTDKEMEANTEPYTPENAFAELNTRRPYGLPPPPYSELRY